MSTMTSFTGCSADGSSSGAGDNRRLARTRRSSTLSHARPAVTGPAQMMYYLWPKWTSLVQRAVAEFMKRNGAGDTPKEVLTDLPQRLLVRSTSPAECSTDPKPEADPDPGPDPDPDPDPGPDPDPDPDPFPNSNSNPKPCPSFSGRNHPASALRHTSR